MREGQEERGGHCGVQVCTLATFLANKHLFSSSGLLYLIDLNIARTPSLFVQAWWLWAWLLEQCCWGITGRETWKATRGLEGARGRNQGGLR